MILTSTEGPPQTAMDGEAGLLGWKINGETVTVYTKHSWQWEPNVLMHLDDLAEFEKAAIEIATKGG